MSALDDLLLRTYQESVAHPPNALVDCSQTAEPDGPSSQASAAKPEENDLVAAGPESQGDRQPDSLSAHASASPPGPRLFRPEWEVDAFRWPTVCLDLEDRIGEPLAEAVCRIRQDGIDAQTKVVAVVGSRPNVGSTSMALCLAREAARQGLAVALLDLNHANPDVAESLGIEFEDGIESVDGTAVAAERVGIKAVDCGIVIFPTTASIDVNFCVGESVQSFVRVVAAAHDLVLIDASPEVLQQLSACGGFGPFGCVVVQASAEENAALLNKPETDDQAYAKPFGVIENFAA